MRQGPSHARAVWAGVVALGLGSASSAGELRGHILSADKPVAGATVSAVPYESAFEAALREARHREESKPLATTRTGPDGSYVLSIPPAAGGDAVGGGLVRLRVSGNGLLSALLEPVFDSTETADVGEATVAKTVALAGRVVDAQGGAMVGATVTLWGEASRLGRRDGAALPVTTTTAADGTFRFAEASEGGNRLRVEAPGFAFVETTGVRSGALRRPIVLALARGLRGNVVREDRKTPGVGALVRFEGRGTSRWAEVRADGSFLLDGLPAEGGTLVADAGDRGRGESALEAGAVKATVVLTPTGAIKGRVVDSSSGAPIARVRVVAQNEGASFLGRSGSDGRYEIRGLAGRVYMLSADDPAYVRWSRGGVRVAGGAAQAEDVILTRAATLSGRVVDESGAPIEGAIGRLAPAGESGPRAFMTLMRADQAFRSGRDGSFKATRLGPGNNQSLTVQHPDYDARVVGGVSLLAATPARVNVVLRAGLSLRGVVKDERSQPIAGADVELGREIRFQSRGGGAQLAFLGGPGASPKRQTGPDGSFQFKGLSAADYSVTVTKHGYGRERIDRVKVAESKAVEPLEIVVRPGATISGYVRNRSGSGAAGYRVSARPTSASGAAPSAGPFRGPSTEDPTGDDGSFVIEGVVAGETYELQTMGDAVLGPRKGGITAPAEGVELTVDGRGRIHGVATDADGGRPLRDFEVKYTQARGAGMMVRFNVGGSRGRGPDVPVSFHTEDGGFTLEDVSAGKWDVEVKAQGYQPGHAGGVVVEEGATTDRVDVRLSRGGVLSGRVTESRAGGPVRDAAVRVELTGGGVGPRINFGAEDDGRQASSDADGHFELSGLAPGSYVVTATHAEWSETTEKVELKEAAATVELRMNAGASIGGLVVGGGQRPVAGATVTLVAAGSNSPFSNEEMVADAAGRFRFERVNPGRYSLTASLRNQSSSAVEVVVQSGNAGQDVSLALNAGATIRGLVSGLPETQRSGVNVSASGPEEFFASTRTDADGTFDFDGVPVGAISLRASSGDLLTGSRSAGTQVIVAAGQLEASAEIVFEAGFRLDGRVTRGGKPVTEAIVTAFPESGPGHTASGRTDEAGAFALDGLQSGTYTVTAMTMSGGGGAIRKTVPVSGDTSVELEAPSARLAGTIVEQSTGRPLADVSVRIEETSRGFMGVNAVTSDTSGRFAFEGLEPRTYRVAVQKPAYQAETRELTAAEDSDVVVELRRGEGIGVVAKDGIYGTPLRGLNVRVLDPQGLPVFTGGISLDRDGNGEIPSLRPGTYALRADSQGYAPVSVPAIAVPSPALSLALTPGGALEIQVGPETLALPSAAGRVLYPTGAVYFPFLFSPDGLVRLASPVRRLDNVVPGSYVFAVDGGARKAFEVREGGTAVVSLP